MKQLHQSFVLHFLMYLIDSYFFQSFFDENPTLYGYECKILVPAESS